MLFSTATSSNPEDQLDGPLTLERLMKARQALYEACPYYRFMRSKGVPPNEGWIMVLPMTGQTPDHPDYVRFSPVVPAGTCYFINEKEANPYACRP